MEDLAIEYVNEIANKEEFQRLLYLKKEIDKKYAMLIISFKTKEANYLEARDNPEKYDLEKAQKEFVEVKAKLYAKEEVIEYFSLERKINALLDNDMKEIKESISSNFSKDKTIHML